MGEGGGDSERIAIDRGEGRGKIDRESIGDIDRESIGDIDRELIEEIDRHRCEEDRSRSIKTNRGDQGDRP